MGVRPRGRGAVVFAAAVCGVALAGSAEKASPVGVSPPGAKLPARALLAYRSGDSDGAPRMVVYRDGSIRVRKGHRSLTRHRGHRFMRHLRRRLARSGIGDGTEHVHSRDNRFHSVQFRMCHEVHALYAWEQRRPFGKNGEAVPRATRREQRLIAYLDSTLRRLLRKHR